MTKLTAIVFFLIFFIGSNVLNTLKIDNYTFFYLIVAMSLGVLAMSFRDRSFRDRKYEIGVLLLIAFVIVYRMYAGILTDSLRSAAILFATPLIYLLVPKEIRTKDDYLVKRKIVKIIIAFYVFECLVAIAEYLLRTHFFLWIDTTFQSHLMNIRLRESFRSVALHGAPLSNALMVTVLSAFFITSSLKDKYKFALWGLGFVAVLAFNARMAIIVNLGFFGFYILKLLGNRKAKFTTKLFIYAASAAFFMVAAYLVFYQGLGDRLFKKELLDEASAQKRFDLFSIFDGHTVYDFLFGRSMREFDMMKELAGLLIIENFWVCEIVLFGGLFVAGMVILYIKLLAPYVREYSFYNRMVICLSFILLASTNNSLFTQYLPLLLFVVCLNLFRPDTFRMILPPKYIDRYALTRQRR
ncbi:hypothetical protein [Dyadobacter sp. 676]|uniref:O-antigen ligase family protein n=1 Tax=Dyadobacter sp. 676 TaxID=3088362 RepID=A0AAU8FP17_9BACT